MRKYLLAAAASAAIAAPAAAQEIAPTSGPYVGIEGGVLFPKNTTIDVTTDDFHFENAFEAEHDMGFDVDAVAGYDLGLFRIEGELGYKRAGVDGATFDPEFIEFIEDETGVPFDDSDFDADGNVSVLSGMVNALVDLDAGPARFYGGAGLGRAGVKFAGESDSAWAYQLIAGVGVPVSSGMEAGLKYRYFRTGKVRFDDDTFAADSFKSHSVLASLMFNFGRPAAAPIVPVVVDQAPPPAPAPATQVCPDGTVILATDVCPAPPPPLPPVQGERG